MLQCTLPSSSQWSLRRCWPGGWDKCVPCTLSGAAESWAARWKSPALLSWRAPKKDIERKRGTGFHYREKKKKSHTAFLWECSLTYMMGSKRPFGILVLKYLVSSKFCSTRVCQWINVTVGFSLLWNPMFKYKINRNNRFLTFRMRIISLSYF